VLFAVGAGGRGRVTAPWPAPPYRHPARQCRPAKAGGRSA